MLLETGGRPGCQASRMSFHPYRSPLRHPAINHSGLLDANLSGHLLTLRISGIPQFETPDTFHLAERPGSGDGEREASMTRQMPFEPLPASVLFAIGAVDPVWLL
jgi:hypothetical protein